MTIKSLTLIMVFSALVRLTAGAQGTWTQKANMLGNPRYNLIGFAIGEKGYIAGGTFGGLTVSNNCQEFNPVANTWMEKSPMPAAFRAGTGFSGGNYGYATTGVNEAMFIQELYEYNALGNNWSTTSFFPAEVRMYASGFGIGRNGYITCGTYINLYPLNDLWEYNQLANNWSQKASLPGSARSNATAFSTDLKGYVFGGTDGSSVFNDLWEYDPATDSWAQKASLPGQGRTDAMAFAIGDYAYLIGGWPGGGNALAEVWQYNIVNDSWLQLPDFPGIPTAGGAAFAVNSLGYVVGGYGSIQCWEYDPLGVGISEPVSEHLSVYPNPAETKLTVTVDGGSFNGNELFIYDITGKQMVSQSLKGNVIDEIDVSALLPGIYLLQVRKDDKLESLRFIKQ